MLLNKRTTATSLRPPKNQRQIMNNKFDELTKNMAQSVTRAEDLFHDARGWSH